MLNATLLAATAAAFLLFQVHNAGAENMNGGPYRVGNAPEYSGVFESEYFDVYSPPIKTQYSEVFWRMQEPVPLPDEIQERFKNKVMAVVGYEVDQVQKTDSGDVPVPITWAYNHHYCAYLTSPGVEFVKMKGGAIGQNHGSDEHWMPVVEDNPSPTTGFPRNQFFSEGNGGEFRKSYHGYPKGYAQLIESPNTFRIQPMQIDTWNRNMESPHFAAGPLPKSSGIPASAGYSGLIECPCSDRLKKEWAMTYGLETSRSCIAPVANSSECFYGARQVIQANAFVEKEVSDSSIPPGCAVEPREDGSAEIIWNSEMAYEDSHSLANNSRVVAYSHGLVNLTVHLTTEEGARMTLQGPEDQWFGIGFGSDTMCVHPQADTCPDGGPYAIIVVGDDVEEYTLDFHGPGRVLDPTVKVESNAIENGMRKVVLTRALKGLTSDYYSFNIKVVSVPIIVATGCSLTYGHHCKHMTAELNFLPSDTPTGVCQKGVAGKIGGHPFHRNCAPYPTGELASHDNPTCSLQKYRGGLLCCRDGQSLLDQDQENPWPGEYLEYHLKFRFYFEEYRGALGEFRSPPSHKDLLRLYWTTEAFAGEYDILQCEENTPPSQCIQVITSRFKVHDTLRRITLDPNVTAGIELIYAGPHCHAPTCLSMELYNDDTGELICSMEPTRGQSDEQYDERGFLTIPPCLWGDTSEGLPPPKLLTLDTNLLSIKRNNNTLGHTGEMASWQMRGAVVPRTTAEPETPKS